jgi:16S rRNA (guanine527-N7)-methyltransferase
VISLTSQQYQRLAPVLERAFSFGFLGPGPIDSHIDNAMRFAAEVSAIEGSAVPVRCLDLGSGGGVPGLVLAVLWPHTSWTLLDAMHKRCEFLRWAVEELTLDAQVVEGRAENLGRHPQLRSSFDLVTSRSFGPPGVMAECASPFLRADGMLLVSEPPDEKLASGSRWSDRGLAELGLTLVREGSPIAVFRQELPCPDRFPRRVGVPGKRPLF